MTIRYTQGYLILKGGIKMLGRNDIKNLLKDVEIRAIALDSWLIYLIGG